MKANELSCKDLMVGDWVKPKNVDVSFRVGLIGADSVWNDTDTHEWYYDELEPIPLTAEILEKNGWVEDGYFYRHKELGYIQLGKLFEHASFDFTKNGINYRIQTSPRCMKYIHQLQHILSIVGSNKTIII